MNILQQINSNKKTADLLKKEATDGKWREKWKTIIEKYKKCKKINESKSLGLSKI